MEDNIVFEAMIYSILQSPRPINARFWYIARLKFLKSATLSSLFGRQMCSMQMPAFPTLPFLDGRVPVMNRTYCRLTFLILSFAKQIQYPGTIEENRGCQDSRR
jgi:hypothetical protein